MGIADLNGGGILTGAVLTVHLAAVTEVAVVGHIDGVGHAAGDVVQAFDLLTDNGLGTHQTNGVGMAGIVENVSSGTLFDHTTGVHNHNVVSHTGNHAQVMGD